MIARYYFAAMCIGVAAPSHSQEDDWFKRRQEDSRREDERRRDESNRQFEQQRKDSWAEFERQQEENRRRLEQANLQRQIDQMRFEGRQRQAQEKRRQEELQANSHYSVPRAGGSAAKSVIAEGFRTLADQAAQNAEYARRRAEQDAYFQREMAKLRAEAETHKPKPAVIAPNREAEIAKVERAHPGFRGLIKTEGYIKWMASQPAGFQALADSPRSEDAILVLDMYKAYYAQNK